MCTSIIAPMSLALLPVLLPSLSPLPCIRHRHYFPSAQVAITCQSDLLYAPQSANGSKQKKKGLKVLPNK